MNLYLTTAAETAAELTADSVAESGAAWLEKLGHWLLDLAADFGLRLLSCIVLLAVGSAIIKYITTHWPNSKRRKIDPTVQNFTRNFMRAGLWLILVVCMIAILGVPMASIIAAIASAGLAIGLALQGALSNFAGGIMILIFRPFGLGDYVETKGEGGTVIDVGIFYTTLRTGDNKHITIPNGSLMGENITNYSREENRRVDIAFTVAYESDSSRAVELILDEIKKHDLTLDTPTPFCRVTALNDSDVEITARIWARRGDYATVKSDMLERVMARFNAEGIEVPYPQLDVHIKDTKDNK